MKQFLFIFSFVFFLNQAKSQLIQWERNYGGTDLDEGSVIAGTSDGGVIIGGITRSADIDVSGNYGNTDIWLVKIDSVGSIQWERNYGGTSGDAPAQLMEVAGGYMLLASTTSADEDVSTLYGSDDFWLVKLDTVGNILWEKSYGGTGNDTPSKFVHTADGGFLLAGYTVSSDFDVSANYGDGDCWALKVDANGNIEWEKNYGGTQLEGFLDVKTIPGGYIFCGTTTSGNYDVSNSHGLYDLWIVKTDTLGNIIWESAFGGSGYDFGQDVIPTPDGGFIFSGTSGSADNDVSYNYGENDFWLGKVDANGYMEWEKSFGGSGSESLFNLTQSSNGDLILVGVTTSDDGDIDNLDGESDGWILIVGPDGSFKWEETFGGSQSDGLKNILEMNNKFFAIGGSISNNGDVSNNYGWVDMWLLKLNNMLNFPEITTGITSAENEAPAFIIYPNPSTGNFTIQSSEKNYTIKITDVFGRLVYSYFSQSENFNVGLENKLSGGTYFVRINSNSGMNVTQRIIIK